MNKLQQLRSMFLLLFIAILGSTWGAQRAYADTVNEFTGTWYTPECFVGCDSYAGTLQDESSNGPVFFEPFGLLGVLAFFAQTKFTSLWGHGAILSLLQDYITS